MTVQDTPAHAGYIMLPRRVSLGLLGGAAGALIALTIAYATVQSRIGALEKSTEADNKKIDQINARTISMETDIRWIRETMAASRR